MQEIVCIKIQLKTLIVIVGDGHHERLRDEDDELLQFAIQQSLMNGGTENDQVLYGGQKIIKYCSGGRKRSGIVWR